MEIYKYFFYKIYKWASSNKNDYSPEHTALLFTSQSLFFNLLFMVNIKYSTMKFNAEHYCLMIATLGISCVVFNYFFFLRNDRYLKITPKNSMIKNILFLVYLCATYYLFFRSLYLFVPVTGSGG
jgi:hypothetical protein